MVLCEEALPLIIRPMANPDDLIWANVATPADQVKSTKFVIDIIFTFGILVWGAVLAFISAVAQPDQIAEVIPPFENLKGTIVWDLFAGPIPVYLLMIFLMLVPTIIRFAATCVQQQKTRTEVEQYVLQWFFGYQVKHRSYCFWGITKWSVLSQVANIFITVIASSIWDVLSDALDDPSGLATLIAEALPVSAVFFLNFAIAQAIVGNAGTLLNIGGLAFVLVSFVDKGLRLFVMLCKAE